MREVDQPEAERRIRAAMAYKDMSRAAAAKAMSTSPGNLDRFTGKKGKEKATPTWEQLWSLADACGLAPEWFSADLTRLDEIVPAGMPIFAKPPTPSVTPRARAAGQRLDDTQPTSPQTRRARDGKAKAP